MFTGLLARSNWVAPPIPPPPPGDWVELIDLKDEDPTLYDIVTIVYDIVFGRIVVAASVLGGTDDHLWKSDDGGDTWAFLGLVAGTGTDTVKEMVYDVAHSTLVAVLGSQDIYTSTDGGANWTFIENLGAVPYTDAQLVYDPDEQEVIFVARRLGSSYVWRSDDGGDTWINTQTITRAYPTDMIYDTVSHDVFLLFGEAESGTSDIEIWRSANGGSFSFRHNFAGSPENLIGARSLASDVDSGKIMVSGELSNDWRIYSSDDGGVSWDDEGHPGNDNRQYLDYHITQGRLYAFSYGAGSFSSANIHSSLNAAQSWVFEKDFYPDMGIGGRIPGTSLYVPQLEMIFIAIWQNGDTIQIWKSNGQPII